VVPCTLAASVLDYEEAVREFEGHRRHGEEVQGDNCFPMILQKGEPSFSRIARRRKASQMTDSLFGNKEAKLLELAMDSWALPNLGFLRPSGGSGVKPLL
jgi:hypothetical protein